MPPLRAYSRPVTSGDVSTLQITGETTVARVANLFEALAGRGFRGDIVWYGADMCPSVTGFTSDYGTAVFRIGSTAMVLQLLRALEVPQLDFGVFIALPAWIGAEAIPDDVAAEGPSRQRAPASAIEIAVFDDTVIEVTADDAALLAALRAQFGGTLIAT